GAVGTEVRLSLTNALGDFDMGAVFTYRRPPTISRLVLPYGSAASSILIEGEGLPVLAAPHAVWFGAARSPNVYCAEEGCWAAVPAGSGTVPVRVETGAGLSPVTPETMFTYETVP